MTSTLRGAEGCKAKMRCYQSRGGGGLGVSECSGHPIFIFLLKKIGFAICAMTRQNAEPNSILLTRNLPFDSDVRQ